MEKGTAMRVGIVGLGRMGLRLARRLRDGGFQTAGCDVDSNASAAAADEGFAVEPNPAALAARSDLVIVAVAFESQVDATLFGPDGAASAAASKPVVAVAATVEPAYMRRLADRAPGTVFLDIPLARGESAADRGDLLMFAGGDAAAMERCRPAFSTFASEIHHLGGLGAGQVAKAANNYLLWTNVAASVEAFAFGAALGIDREALRRALANSSGANWAMETRADERPALWAEKDMAALLAEADRARLAMPVAGSVREAIKAHKIARGFPMPDDSSATGSTGDRTRPILGKAL